MFGEREYDACHVFANLILPIGHAPDHRLIIDFSLRSHSAIKHLVKQAR